MANASVLTATADHFVGVDKMIFDGLIAPFKGFLCTQYRGLTNHFTGAGKMVFD
ncbi:hypothetical protein KBD69_00385 [Candidatus Woesebacteria bacterium]|nr:hypothetical protein [Candidatus Woesebacteria bacterium]